MLERLLKKVSVKSALAIISLVCIAVPSVIITALLLSNQYRAMVQNAVNTVEDNLSVVTTGMDAMLMQEVDTTMELLLIDDSLHTMLHEAAGEQFTEREHLVEIYLINQHLANVAPHGRIEQNLSLLLDQNGRVYNVRYPTQSSPEMRSVISEFSARSGTNYTNLHWFPLQKNVFDLYIDSPRRAYVIPVVRNLISYKNRQYNGKAVLALYEETVYDCYRSSSLLENGCVYVVDRQGNLVSHSDHSMFGTDFTENPAVTRCLSDSAGGFFDNGRNVYVACRPVNNGQWLCITEASLAPINQEITRGMISYLILAGVVTAIAIAAVIYLARQVVAPFDDLMHSMHAAAKHDFSHRVEKRGTKDTLQLIDNYNDLLQETNDLIYHKYETVRKQQQAELDALAMQITPHFLYNTLDSISWKVRNAGMPEVSDMLYCLGKMFNHSVNKGKRLCTLRRELEHVEMYIRLQNLRYGNKFRLAVSVEDEELLDHEITKLIMQPLVENSIQHGFRDRTENCRLHIHVQCDGSRITIYIEDNGCGIPPDQLQTLRTRLADGKIDYYEQQAVHNQERGAGIGIINVHQRIRLYYGKAYGIEIEESTPDGTCIAIHLPNRSE